MSNAVSSSTTGMTSLNALYNLNKWPVKVAGPCPTAENIHDAHALLLQAKGGKGRVFGSGEALAIAAYLRPADVCVNTKLVARALNACLGLSATNNRDNVINQQLGATAKGREATGSKQLVERTAIPGHIKVTTLGMKAIERFKPVEVKAEPVETPKPPKPKAPRKPKVPTDTPPVVPATPVAETTETASATA